MHAHTFHGMVENLYREAQLDRPRRGDSSQSISIRKQVRTEYQFRFIDEETYWNPNSINPSERSRSSPPLESIRPNASRESLWLSVHGQYLSRSVPVLQHTRMVHLKSISREQTTSLNLFNRAIRRGRPTGAYQDLLRSVDEIYTCPQP